MRLRLRCSPPSCCDALCGCSMCPGGTPAPTGVAAFAGFPCRRGDRWPPLRPDGSGSRRPSDHSTEPVDAESCPGLTARRPRTRGRHQRNPGPALRASWLVSPGRRSPARGCCSDTNPCAQGDGLASGSSRPARCMHGSISLHTPSAGTLVARPARRGRRLRDVN